MMIRAVHFAVLVACTACGAGERAGNIQSDDKQGVEMTSSDKAAIENALGFALPQEARVLVLEREFGLDDMLRAKIEMPRSSFNLVAPQLPVQLSTMTSGPGRLSADHGAWDPRSMPGLRAGQVARPGGRFLNVGFAESNEHVILFIVDHGT